MACFSHHLYLIYIYKLHTSSMVNLNIFTVKEISLQISKDSNGLNIFLLKFRFFRKATKLYEISKLIDVYLKLNSNQLAWKISLIFKKPELYSQTMTYNATKNRIMRLAILIWLFEPKDFIIKFIYSEKATKLCEISTLLLSTVHTDKSKVEISQKIVAFSEYMNFTAV